MAFSFDGEKFARALFKGVCKGAKDGVPGIIGEVVSEVSDAFDLSGGVNGLVQELMLKALASASEKIFKEYDDILWPEEFDFGHALKAWGRDLTLPTDLDPFEPSSLKAFMAPLQALLVRMLTESGAVGAQEVALCFARRLPDYFATELHRCWGGDPNRYQKILDRHDTPFKSLAGRERDWLVLRQRMILLAAEPVFREAFSLRDIFIPLRGYSGDPKLQLSEETKEHPYRYIPDVVEALVEWAGDPKVKPDETIRVVTGGPGSGKSSVLKMLAGRLAEQHRNVLYAPLRLVFGADQRLKDGLLRFVRDEFQLKHLHDINDLREQPLILLLDGLDELELNTKDGGDLLTKLVDGIKDLRDESLRAGASVRLVLGGRELVVRNIAHRFDQPDCALHLYAYTPFAPKSEIAPGPTPGDPLYSGWYRSDSGANKLYAINSDGLNRHDVSAYQDQRPAWWARYGALTGRAATPPQALAHGPIRDLSRQPLLNYLLALLDQRDGLDGVDSLYGVYEGLITDIHRRKWDPKYGTGHSASKDLGTKDFIRFLELIALATWRGDSRSTTPEEVEAVANALRIEIPKVALDPKSVAQLMVAFYFKHTGVDGPGRYEFTHKSFGEFLVVRALVGLMLKLSKDRVRKQEDGDYWDIDEALSRFLRFTGGAPLENSHLPFVKDALSHQIKEGKLDIKDVCTCAQAMFNHQLRHSWPLIAGQSDRIQTLYATAVKAENALLMILCHLGATQQDAICLAWPSHNSAKMMFHRFHANCDFEDQDWTLPNSIIFVNMMRQNLYRIDMSNLSLYRCNFNNADLSHADLSYANLSEVDLSMADLSKADLSETDLSKADLYEADLSRANLSQANLIGADLICANLIWTNLNGANLSGADLSGADLSNAHLSFADLREADLSGADLSAANLFGGKLRGANFFRAKGSPKGLPQEMDWDAAIAKDGPWDAED